MNKPVSRISIGAMKKLTNAAGAARDLAAVCFDFRGVLLDHRDNRSIIPGMERLLKALKDRQVELAIVSRFPAEILVDLLGPLRSLFGENLYSSGGEGKLGCIRRFARDRGIGDLSRIAFVDDKPENFLPVAEKTKVYVIGFKGSGKYAEARKVCEQRQIPYADDASDLEEMLL